MRGDDAAFVQIYDLYFEYIKRCGTFNGWSFHIGCNLVIFYYRAKKVTVNIDDLENVLEYDDNILERTNFDFDQRMFMDALRKLGADQQLVLKLKFLDELENDEIAVLLNKSEGAIRVIQHRAIAELKKLLNQDEQL